MKPPLPKNEDVYKFSEHAIIIALNFNEQLRVCIISIQIHDVYLDLRAYLTRTYEEKKYMLYIWITQGYYYEIRGDENTWDR